MRRGNNLCIYAEELTAEKKFRLKKGSVFDLVAGGEDFSKVVVHFNGRIYGKFLWDRVLCQKVCKTLGIPRKDLFEKDENGKIQVRADFLREKFAELTGYDCYWDNLQKMLDMVATYNYGKNVKFCDFDAVSERTPTVLRPQIDFRIKSALDLGVRRGVITEEECKDRMKKIENILTDENVYVLSDEKSKEIQVKEPAAARFIKDRVSCQKICKVLGIKRKDLFQADGQLFNIDLVQSGFKRLTGVDEYWEILQAQLDFVATYHYGKKKRYKYDQETESQYSNALGRANHYLRCALNDAFLADRITLEQYLERMEKLRTILVNEAVPDFTENSKKTSDMSVVSAFADSVMDVSADLEPEENGTYLCKK